MNRILTLIAFLFATSAWADDARYYLGDGGVSDFYSMPHAGKYEEAGKLLKKQSIDRNLLLADASKGERILYTSTSGLDETSIVHVSGALFLPKGKPPKAGWPLLSWSHGTVGIADQCAPSWDGYPDFHRDYLGHWLRAGFAIIASDYEGLGTKGTHPYLATRPAAFSNLDAIRAVQSAGYPLSKGVFFVGQSQGAAAALASAGHAKSYAPEIKVQGVVATGIPFFSPKALIVVREKRPRDVVDPQLGYNFLALSLVQLVDPNFSMNDYLSDKARPVAQGISKICNRDMRKLIASQKLTYETTFTQSPNAGLEKAFKLMQYPRLALDMPIFIASGARDQDTPLRMQLALVRRLCDQGTRVRSLTYDDKAHLTTLTHSIRDAMDFVSSIQNGNRMAGNCHIFEENN
ncbi:lipase family protein [Alphaproteobacteria bacterium]|nr:lipase family protein [Alphaproteobacteria bacterium]